MSQSKYRQLDVRALRRHDADREELADRSPAAYVNE